MTILLENDPQETATHSPRRQPRLERRRANRFVMGNIALALALAAAALIVELAFRLFVPVISTPEYFWDPVVGPRRVPNTAGRFVSGNNIDAHYHFNAQGWNASRDYSTTKAPGTRRVVLVGDSFVEALQVNQDESMFHVAEQAMTTPERPVEWYALGNSGWGSAQQYQVIRHYALDYEPDLVVLLFVENDPYDTSPYLVSIEPQIASYVLGPQDELVYRQPQFWERDFWKRLAMHSDVIRWFVLQRGFLINRNNIPDHLNMPLREAALIEHPEVTDPLLKLPLEEREQLTWKLIEKTIAATAALCEQNGTRLAIAYRGSMLEIEAAREGAIHWKPPVDDDPYCLGPRRFEMGREMVAPICERLGIPYLDLTDALKEAVTREQASHVFPDDPHYNVLGQRVAGETLARWVEALWTSDTSPESHAATPNSQKPATSSP
ncbi:MAG: hypothetical protein KF708_23030 [Pirellulales bacterium]|nr:hypothetical protein [Pirellulales bacterium]